MADQVSGPLRVLVESRREQVIAIAARHHASRVRLFGSAARGEDRPDSDIDLLVDFDQAAWRVSRARSYPYQYCWR